MGPWLVPPAVTPAPVTAVPRAIVSRSPRRLVKLVAERGTGRILGVHLLADGAGHAILAGMYAIEGGMIVRARWRAAGTRT
jgi:mercuric reductase